METDGNVQTGFIQVSNMARYTKHHAVRTFSTVATQTEVPSNKEIPAGGLEKTIV
jgi:hypothetical protein